MDIGDECHWIALMMEMAEGGAGYRMSASWQTLISNIVIRSFGSVKIFHFCDIYPRNAKTEGRDSESVVLLSGRGLRCLIFVCFVSAGDGSCIFQSLRFSWT
jgi:hypothetical protein